MATPANATSIVTTFCVHFSDIARRFCRLNVSVFAYLSSVLSYSVSKLKTFTIALNLFYPLTYYVHIQTEYFSYFFKINYFLFFSKNCLPNMFGKVFLG